MSRIRRLLNITKQLMAKSVVFEQHPTYPTQTILFLGDSTAVGTGSDFPQHSVAGRIGGEFPKAEIINRGINGQKIHQLATKLDPKGEVKADILIIMIGGNDILKFTSISSIKKDLKVLLEKAFKISSKVLILHSGKVGDAPFFPKALGWIWNLKAAQVRKLYIKEAKTTGATYVDLFQANLTLDDYSDDLVHPNQNGYKIWTEAILKSI